MGWVDIHTGTHYYGPPNKQHRNMNIKQQSTAYTKPIPSLIDCKVTETYASNEPLLKRQKLTHNICSIQYQNDNGMQSIPTIPDLISNQSISDKPTLSIN